ncbi:MAG TPA: hypothetical protein VFZ34_09230 [Blastocatellia bacterium]|nr:hypothetical protein [Blastocatellia bacterium]
MKHLMGLASLLLCAGLVFGQDSTKPLTKDELLRALKTKPAPGKRDAQGDLAGEIEARGIAFPADEKTLEELRQAGARTFVIDAVKQAAQDAARPKLKLPPATPPPAQPVAEPTQRKEEEESKEPTAEDLAKLPLIEQARYHALKFLDELPNFIVTQHVTRSVQTPEQKDWQQRDKLEIELSYRVKDGEKFKLIKMNDRPTSMSYESLGGATSTGEFGSMLAALFSPQSQATFKEVRKENFKGRPTVLFEYAVKKANSSNTITDKTSGRSVTTAYAGTIWVDVETARVLRIEQSSEDIQRGFPITLAESAVEYEWVKIGDQKYLLPLFAEVLMGSDINRTYSRNVIELKNYKVFETGIKMILDKEP